MKIPPLPDIDLARIAPLPDDQKRKHLQSIRQGRPPFSYEPVRSCFADIFNIIPQLFPKPEVTSWSIIHDRLKKKSKSDKELKANTQVAGGLYSFSIDKNLSGREHIFNPLSLGNGRKLTFWLPMVLNIAGVPVVPFVDPRRSSKGLTQTARQFVFSVMHERIRAADPDFESVRLAVFRFKDQADGHRSTILYDDSAISLFSFEELENMTAATYAIWEDICRGREEDERRKGTGTSGPLL